LEGKIFLTVLTNLQKCKQLHKALDYIKHSKAFKILPVRSVPFGTFFAQKPYRRLENEKGRGDHQAL
jgi:hypothetical protein